MEKISDETRSLRRTMRDLVALSALPAVWAGYQPRQVAEGLADVLLKTLRLDLVYLRLRGQTPGQEIEVFLTPGPPTTTEQLRAFSKQLAPWLKGARSNSTPSIPNSVGRGTVHLVINPIGCDGNDGLLIAGSQQAGFPTEEDCLLLSVAANQAAAVIQRQRAEEALRESEQRFRTFVDHATDAFFLQDDRGVILDVNRQACESLGYSRDELIGKAPPDFDPDATPVLLEKLGASLNAGEPVAFESRHRRKDGTLFPVDVRGRAFWEGGRRFLVSLARDISDRKQDEALLDGQKRILELIIQGEPLPHVLSVLCRTIEDLAQDSMLASVLLLDADGVHLRRGAAPSLPEGYNRAVEGLTIGPAVGSCGTAAYRREPVYVSDIASDPLWAPFADVALSHGLRACWSTPILSSHAEVLGTFAMYYRQPRRPTPRDLRAVDIVTRTVAIAIEQSRAEQALRESEERFRGTFENAAVGIAHVDVAGRFLRVNEKLCNIVGYTREELLAKTFQDITYSDDLEADLEQFMRLVRGDVPSLSRDKRYVRKDGSPVWVAVSVSLQRDAADRPLNTISVVRDITERKRLEKELRHAKDVAEAANQAKDEFLANVSHEIRTPMNAILGMTELVLDTPLTEDQWQCLKTVKSAADNLLGIINDLLDFSKIQAGKLELAPADFGLRAAVGDTLRALAVRAHSKGLELVCHLQPNVPDALVGDAGRLRQVLFNLVGNAVKFTDQGEVVVGVSIDKETRRQGDKETESDTAPVPLSPCLLVFEVRDTGIGIPKDRQERIFRAFEQEDTSTTRKYGGTGLGLTIASRLVDLMGGQITVESEPGQGSTFAFTARFGLQPHQPEPAESPGAYATRLAAVMLRDLPVLIVDDNATNRQILEGWLRGYSMKPAAVGDGLAALDALQQGVACGRPYALMLLDARMPDTDGLALAAQVRKRAEGSATRIILLTAGDRPGDLARSRELRIDAHLLKPVQQNELRETIYRVMSRRIVSGRVASGVDQAFEPDLRLESLTYKTHLHILVAEDNEFNAQLLEQLLVRHGHRVQLATNGRDVLALLGIRGQKSGVRDQESGREGDAPREGEAPAEPLGQRLGRSLALPDSPEFDLLLLDLHMPELDGFQVIQAVRNHEQSAKGHLPVIALTARARREDRERCLAAGMDDFLAKPIQATNLWAAIDRIVIAQEKRGSKIEVRGLPKNEDQRSSFGEGGASGASYGPGTGAFTRPARLDPRSSILDPHALLAACGGDAIILEKICQAFRAVLPDHWSAVQDALQAPDLPRLREAAHKLCGMVAAFSAVTAEVASDLEDRAAQGLLEEARPLVGRLEPMVLELLHAVVGLTVDALREQRTGE